MALKITSLNDAPLVSEKFNGRVLLSSPSLSIIHLSLAEGEYIARHRNDMDVFFYILSGKGMLDTEDASVVLDSGILAEVSANEERAIKNIGAGSLRLLVLKIPARPCE